MAHSLTVQGTIRKLIDWASDLGGSSTPTRISEVGTGTFEQLLPDECFTEQELNILFCPIMRW